MNELESLKKKIKYRSSYRGTKEMDLLLSSFVSEHIDNLSLQDLIKLDDFSDWAVKNGYENNRWHISNQFDISTADNT